MSMQCERQKSIIIFISRKFYEMDADTEKGQTDLGCGHKILVEIGLSFFLGGGGECVSDLVKYLLWPHR